MAGDGQGQGQVDVVGYGLGFRPLPAFEVGRVSPARVHDTLIFAHAGGDGRPRNLLVEPGQAAPSQPLRRRPEVGGQGGWVYRDGPDGPSVHLGLHVRDPAEVARPVPGASERAWKLRTRGYEASWPDGWSLASTRPGSAWPFELRLAPDRGGDALVIVRGPLPREAVAALERLVGPGQELLELRATATTVWMEVAYELDGQAWRQHHELAPLGDQVLLVTSQARAEQAGAAADAAALLARSARPVPDPAPAPVTYA